MDALFLRILNMSITASYVILFVIVARLLLKKAPKIFSYALWLVVLFRLICPFSFESIFSLMPVNTQTVPQNIMYSQTPQIHSGITVIDRVVNNSLPAPAVSASANPMEIWIALGEIVWLLGIGVLLAYSIFTAIKLYIRLKPARLVSDNIYEIGGIKTAFVFGIIKPKIYIPTSLSENEKAYIIKHEETHIKRLDHIIKLLGFLVLCVHWFNPLVWVAFFLMVGDMELSCDESVIKQMGSNIKKEYSTSLLSLSTGRRVIGGCPIAFGENNTKGRIMNILNYKKPAFWVVIVTVIAVIAVLLGLMSNPQKEQMTVEDYANQFVKQEIANYEKFYSLDWKIVDSKITKLEKIGTFDELYSSPLEIWSLEYRLKPDDISKVMFAGGMNEVDGWITEDSSMGKPILVFSREGSQLQYLGRTWNGESDFTTIPGQETALRIFLEGINLLPHETYKGNHIIIKFPLSTGETSQLFLSQPVTQGELGIWCVERWKDTNGNEYYVTPQTDGKIIDYYKELQKQSNDGHKPSLLDPMQVALDYINNELGQNVSLNKLVVEYSATVEDFAKTPESHFIGFIMNFSVDEVSFHFDQVEWLTLNDTERLKELNINPENDMPNGYYIHNPQTYPMYCEVNEETKYTIINWGGGDNPNDFHKSVNKEEFKEYLDTYLNRTPPFRIVTKDGYVQSITEQYVP